jgi:GNAT superfamily N-acetyltransferase
MPTSRENPRMDFELIRCVEGDRWFPWNYGRRSRRGRVGMKRFVHEPGLVVLNAVAPPGHVLGSCALRIGYRHSEYVLGDEGYRYGAAAAGPAYFWPDDESCPWILVLKSFWIRPDARRKGIARRFAAYARDIGLPAYLAFANKNVETWFDRQFRPTREASPLQAKIMQAMRIPSGDRLPEEDADFTVFVQAEAPALLLWRAWHGGLEEAVSLDRALMSPDRADVWAVDSGEVFEAGFSDSAFAEDRCFGYTLGSWCDAWGPESGPFDELSADASDEVYETTEAAYSQQSCFVAGSVDGWIIDAEAMCAYASVRHFLRTLTLRDYDDVNDAARELFVRDLRDEPRGLRRFSALVSPIDRPSD